MKPVFLGKVCAGISSAGQKPPQPSQNHWDDRSGTTPREREIRRFGIGGPRYSEVDEKLNVGIGIDRKPQYATHSTSFQDTSWGPTVV